MNDTTEPKASDIFSRFEEMTVSGDGLEAARRFAAWTSGAPNPVIIVGPNGSGKTTLLRMIADLAQQSAPKKKVVWLSERIYSHLPEAEEVVRSMSAGDRILYFVNEVEEVLSSDMLVVDDVIGMLDSVLREQFWDSMARFVARGVPVAMTLSNTAILPAPGTEARHSLLSRGALIQLIGYSENHASAEQAAARLQAVDVEALPQQVSAVPQFVYNGDGRIEVAPEDPPAETPEKVELYEELRAKARSFLTHLPRENNQTARLRGVAEAFAEFLPPDLMAVKPRRLWGRGNTLRRYRDADLRLRRSRDPEEAALPELVAELLSDLVDQYNVFAVHDAVLRELDAASLGPRDRADVLLQLESGRALSEGLVQANLLAPSAAAVLTDATRRADEAAKEEGINADQALDEALKTQRNGAIALLLRAVSEVKSRLKIVEDGALQSIGSGTAKLVYTSVVRLYERQISALLGRVQGHDVATYVLRLMRDLLGS